MEGGGRRPGALIGALYDDTQGVGPVEETRNPLLEEDTEQMNEYTYNVHPEMRVLIGRKYVTYIYIVQTRTHPLSVFMVLESDFPIQYVDPAIGLRNVVQQHKPKEPGSKESTAKLLVERPTPNPTSTLNQRPCKNSPLPYIPHPVIAQT